MRLEFFAILILGSLLSLFAAAKSKLTPLIVISGVFLLVCSVIIYAEGLDLEAGTQRNVPSGSIDENTLDYNALFVAHTIDNDGSVLFLMWALAAFGLFLLIFGLYAIFAGIG